MVWSIFVGEERQGKRFVGGVDFLEYVGPGCVIEAGLNGGSNFIDKIFNSDISF